MKINMAAFTRPQIFYEVDISHRTCSCPTFGSDGWCKHLIAVGQHPIRKVKLSARPSFSQALSAVVKCLRLRNIEEGVYWLRYCWSFRDRLPGSQFRTVRRLLIGSAEDGHSVTVMEKVSGYFPSLLSKNVPFSEVVTEFLRICKVPNWWHPATGGHDYIHSGMLADRRSLYSPSEYDLNAVLTGILEGIERQDKVSTLYWVLSADLDKDHGRFVATQLLKLAVQNNNEIAERLADIHIHHSKPLRHDNNFLCQSAWMLAGGRSPVSERDATISSADVEEVLQKTEQMPPHIIPEWCCDGIHCAGSDIRYVGFWDRMYAVCRQYAHYNRVDPCDPWLESQFISLDGLNLHPSS